MKELMELVYGILSKYNNTQYGEIKRNDDGVVELESIEITYSLPSQLQNTDLDIRNEVLLNIDIWFRKNYIFEVEDLAYVIDKELNNLNWVCGEKVAKIKRDNTFILNIQDEDPHVKRKQMNYVITFYRN